MHRRPHRQEVKVKAIEIVAGDIFKYLGCKSCYKSLSNRNYYCTTCKESRARDQRETFVMIRNVTVVHPSGRRQIGLVVYPCYASPLLNNNNELICARVNATILIKRETTSLQDIKVLLNPSTVVGPSHPSLNDPVPSSSSVGPSASAPTIGDIIDDGQNRQQADLVQPETDSFGRQTSHAPSPGTASSTAGNSPRKRPRLEDNTEREISSEEIMIKIKSKEIEMAKAELKQKKDNDARQNQINKDELELYRLQLEQRKPRQKPIDKS